MRGANCNQFQWVRVTGVNNNTNLTIFPGVYMTNYQAVLFPQILFNGQHNPAAMIGVEDMTLNLLHIGNSAPGIDFDSSINCWVRNVETTNSWYAGVRFLYSEHGQVEGCYFHDTATGGAAESYGVDPNASSDVLIENNIFNKITAPILFDAGASGCVAGYNYCTNMIYSISPGWLALSFNTHGAHPTMNLFEGNIGTGVSFDIIHGSSSHNAVFRNQLYGYATNLNNYTANFYINNTYCASIMTSNRNMTLIGNVLGTDGYHTNYEVAATTYPTNYGNIQSICLLGFFGNYGGTNNADPLAVTSLLCDGNYDYATHSTQWDINGAATLPASLYLTSQPSWWNNSVPWPAIGSDLTPMVSKLPAQLWLETMLNNSLSTLSPPKGLNVFQP